VALQVATDEVKDTHCFLTGRDLSGDSSLYRARCLPLDRRRGRAGDPECCITHLEKVFERLSQRLEVNGAIRSYTVNKQRLDGEGVLARLAERGRDGPVTGEGGGDLSVDLSQTFGGLTPAVGAGAIRPSAISASRACNCPCSRELTRFMLAGP
jgi:hypothetical protein